MGSLRKFVLHGITVGTVCLALVCAARAQNSATFVPGELLVKYAPATKLTKAVAANMAVGATVLEDLGDTGWQRVKLPSSRSVEAAAAEYRSLQGVEYAQPNFYYHLLNTPNDPLFSNPGMYGLGKISAPSAWDLSTGSASVVVADIDTGLHYTHEDLVANVWTNPGEIPNNGIDDDGDGLIDDVHGWDFRFNDNDPTDLDPVPGQPGVFATSGHGSHTAGTIGAVGNNLVGVVGVNWNVKIMAIKIFNNNVSDDTTSAMLVNAYNYVRMMKNRGINIRATNNSYGGCTEACGFDQATKDALDALGNAGVVNVFAAGNAGSNNDTTPFYPASYNSPNEIVVAASDSNDQKAGFSNFGVTSVDLAAPGAGILSTWTVSDPNSPNFNSTYNTISGTSMASPHVAGAIALLSAFRPNLSAAALKSILLTNVDALPAWNGVVRTGGRLNVFKALQSQNTTAAGVTVAGRVVSRDGNGIRGAVVTITDAQGAVRSAMTNAFGYYRFDSVRSGASYVVQASARRARFSPRTLSLTDQLSDLNFIDGQ